uniref:Uncharacterized protein n=1 Tax=Biomphalaria glabrata TaxID=6526 RepID=A0A2C9KKX5_BIOGL
MGKKKGHVGQKKVQGQKAKSLQKAKKLAKAKAKERKNKAVKTNLKKINFNNNKKINLLNADITKVLLAPAKLQVASTSQPTVTKSGRDEDQDMPDVGSVSDKFASM